MCFSESRLREVIRSQTKKSGMEGWPAGVRKRQAGNHNRWPLPGPHPLTPHTHSHTPTNTFTACALVTPGPTRGKQMTGRLSFLFCSKQTVEGCLHQHSKTVFPIVGFNPFYRSVDLQQNWWKLIKISKDTYYFYCWIDVFISFSCADVLRLAVFNSPHL